MMDFSINSASQNYKYLIKPQSTAVQTVLPQKPEAESESKKPNSGKKNKAAENVWIGLGALAVIGAASIMIYRAVKGKKSIPPVSENSNSAAGVIDNPLKEIEELKTKIKTDYLNKKSEILKDFDSSVDNKEVEKYKDMRKNASTAIKNKLKKLAEDSDWIELRKIRKKLVKFRSKEKYGEQYDIASKKIELINNVLICKIYPAEEEAFKGKFLMDLSDVSELVKRDFATFEDFQKEYSAKQKYEFELDFNEKFFYKNFKLTLTDLFPEDMKEYDFSKKKIAELYKEPKTKRQEKLKKLAEEFRENDDVKKLKKLNASGN